MGWRFGALSCAALVLLAHPVRVEPKATAQLSIPAVIDDADPALGLTSAERAELHQLYRADAYAPLWRDAEGRLDGNARAALALLASAADDGLDPADYHPDQLAGVAALTAAEPPASQDVARIDVALSSGMLRYFRHVSVGRVDPRAMGFRLDAAADRRDVAAELRAALRDRRIKEAAAALRPPFAQYGALRDVLARYRALPDGLAPDGVPLARRVRQIELALERLRWLPRPGDQRVVVINIPMFRLAAWDAVPASGAPSIAMDVIVGRALGTQTPVFVEQMREVVFRPYWYVPPSIVREEMDRILTSDPGYLAREGVEIIAGSGADERVVEPTAGNIAKLRRGALRARQRPGPRNPLGPIKFVFPNAESVYMHGTPEKALFARNRRDFSHGCVRVEDPVSLAEWVLAGRPDWNRARILAAAAGSATIHVALARPVQVILFYTTAAVLPDDGTIRFAEDIYGHDDRLDRALASR